MKPPPMNLPPLSIPWGRWIQDTESATSDAILLQQMDANSVGSQFSARADLLAAQIRGTNNVSTQYTVDIPPYTRTASGSIGSPPQILESPLVTFNPPRPTGTYTVVLICNMNAEKLSGSNGLNFTDMRMMVDGGAVYRQTPLEENRPGATGESNTNTSSMAAWTVSSGQPTSVMFGLSVTPAYNQTILFAGCSVTAIYIGAL